MDLFYMKITCLLSHGFEYSMINLWQVSDTLWLYFVINIKNEWQINYSPVLQV